MFGLLCLIFAICCDFKDIHSHRGMPNTRQYYGNWVADHDSWRQRCDDVAAGKCTWNTWNDPRIHWEDKLNLKK